MGSISDYLENELLDHIFGGGAYTPASAIYIGLSTADPTDDGTGLAEPSGNNYAREIITFNAAASRLVDQSALVTFNQATGGWGTITHYAIIDAISGGNLLAHGSLATSKQVVSGNTPTVASGEVDISFQAGEISDYLSNILLDFAFRNQAFSVPTIYLALCTVDIADDNTGSTITEPSGNNYARKAHSSWSVAAAGAIENVGAITFNTPSGSWGLITAVGILDAAAAGNLLVYENTVTEQTPASGDTVEVASGACDITLT